MPRVLLTPQLQRFTATPEVESSAATLRAALDDAFAANPALRGHVLDDQGHLRADAVVFIDGRSLLMGSTTGHLWASDDAGDTWQAVALNLRPICAVRFG
jgi:hypothetical protein